MVNAIEKTAMFLGGLGALNWGLVSWFNFNLVDKVLFYVPVPGLNKYVYGLVGLIGAWTIWYTFKVK